MNSPKRAGADSLTGTSSENINNARQDKDNQFTDRTAVQHLKSLHIEEQKRKYPSLPYFSSPDFNVGSSNGITKAVIHFLKLKQHQAERISTTGRYIDNSKVCTDLMGHRRKIGSGTWIPGSGSRGSADISSTIFGLSVKWEIKNEKTGDSQSQAQKEYERQVTEAGGKYYLVKSFADFLNTYYVNFGNHE